MEPTIKIAVAVHKPYPIPDDPIYIPVQVGADLHPETNLGFYKDNEGDNISALNGSYCELTALYWLWKNIEADYKGLVHYRRHFGTLDSERKRASNRFERIATGDDIHVALAGYDAILPRKRNYYIESVYSHYAHTFDARHFDVTRELLVERCPAYVSAWDKLMVGTTAHLYNMMVMQSDLVDAYCQWLFPLLVELERKIDSDGLDTFQARWPGRVSERLFNAWIVTNNINYAELPTVSPEPVDWFAKGKGFLAAKFFGKKYEKSF